MMEADLARKLGANVNCKKRMEADLARKRTIERAQWLRAAILGASDGLLSTTSLILGVSAAKEDRRTMILSGISGALAGAFSMAVGEYVSVSTQRDIEKMMRDKTLAGEDSKGKDIDDIELGHARCEKSDDSVNESPVRVSPAHGHGRWSLKLGVLDEDSSKAHKAGHEEEKFEGDALANPYIAAGASGLAFLFGAIVPIVPTLFVPNAEMRVVILLLAVVASVALALFGGVGAYLGGSSIRISAIRVLFGGWIAMGVTYGLLKFFDTGDE